jgi:hypothetical protein
MIFGWKLQERQASDKHRTNNNLLGKWKEK